MLDPSGEGGRLVINAPVGGQRRPLGRANATQRLSVMAMGPKNYSLHKEASVSLQPSPGSLDPWVKIHSNRTERVTSSRIVLNRNTTMRHFLHFTTLSQPFGFLRNVRISIGPKARVPYVWGQRIQRENMVHRKAMPSVG